jgi:hypothetical protein
MRTKLVLVISLLAEMMGMFAIVGVTFANAQNMSTPETNMTSGNATSGNMTSGNSSYLGPTNMTSP